MQEKISSWGDTEGQQKQDLTIVANQRIQRKKQREREPRKNNETTAAARTTGAPWTILAQAHRWLK